MNGRNIPYIFRGRNITLPRGETAIQIALTGDNLSNRITFVLDKVYNGVDLSAYEPQLLLTGTFMDEPQEDTITLTTGLTKAINGTTIEVVWTVGSTQTYQSGTGTAQIRFVSSSVAVWHSDIFNLSVGSSLSVDESAEEHAPSVIVDHTARLLALEEKTADATTEFAKADDVYAKGETYSAAEIDVLVAPIAENTEGYNDLKTVLGYDEPTSKSAVLDDHEERIDDLEGIAAAAVAAIDNKVDKSQIDTDNNLTANDNNKVASQRAVKTYTDTKFRTIADSYTKSETEALLWNATYIVDTYAEMLAIDNPKNMVSCIVRDASADPTVTSGAAFYKYDKEYPSGATWLKLFEYEGIDVIQTAANVTVTARSAPYNVENQELLNTEIIAQVANKLDKDGGDLKDTVTTFTEAATKEPIATGEKTSTIFGKIKKWFTDLKPHAFTAPSTTLNNGTTTVPSDKLLKESTYAAIYQSIDDPRLTAWFDAQSPAITPSNATPVELASAMVNNSILIMPVNVSSYPNLHPTNTSISGKLVVERTNLHSVEFRFNGKFGNGTTANFSRGVVRILDSSNQWSGWKEIISTDNISTVMPLSSAAARNEKVMSEKLSYDQMALKAPLANPTFTGTVTLPTNLQVYADNAAAIAGGMTAGQMYRTSTGQLMIVY